MLDRVLITILVGLLSLAGFEIVSRLQRQRATIANQTTGRTANPHILYFRSDNCASCATQTQLLAQLDDELQYAIEKIDVDANPKLAEAYGVMSLPTTLVMDAAGNARYINYGVVNPRKLTNQWMTVVG